MPSKSNISKSTIAKEVARQLTKRAELKYWLDTQSLQAVASTGNVYDLSLVPQGDTDSTRDADNLDAVEIRINWQAILADVTNAIRIIVFQWLPSTTPTASQILYQNGTNNAPFGDLVIDTRPMYHVLKDRLFSLTAGTNAISDQWVIKPPASLAKMQYTGGTTVGTNHIYMLVVSDSTASAHPSIVFESDLRYYDF